MASKVTERRTPRKLTRAELTQIADGVALLRGCCTQGCCGEPLLKKLFS
jgi:hypothetical protein